MIESIFNFLKLTLSSTELLGLKPCILLPKLDVTENAAAILSVHLLSCGRLLQH